MIDGKCVMIGRAVPRGWDIPASNVQNVPSLRDDDLIYEMDESVRDAPEDFDCRAPDDPTEG